MADIQSDVKSTGASKPERVDFLKQMIAFTESNVRSFDTKAQISLAAFVLSANPLVAIAGAGCSQSGGKAVLMVLVPAYLATILVYLWVLWPVAQPAKSITEGLVTQNIFFIHDPAKLHAGAFVEKLSNLSVEPELTAEALKLAHIRRVKAGRFKAALIVTVVAYVVIVASFWVVGRCF